jgi:hypothetical protein
LSCPIVDRLHSESHQGNRITVQQHRQRLSQQNLPILLQKSAVSAEWFAAG